MSLIILALGLAGGALLGAAELSTIVTVDVLTTGTCEEIADPQVRDACVVSGVEQHGGALILLGVLALAMALASALASSRAASVALIAIAVIVAALVVLRDVPASRETGLVGLRYEEAVAAVSSGFYLEIAGAALCAVAGTLGLIRR